MFFVGQQRGIDKVRDKARLVGQFHIVNAACDVFGLFAFCAIHQCHARAITGGIAHRVCVFKANMLEKANHQREPQINVRAEGTGEDDFLRLVET